MKSDVMQARWAELRNEAHLRWNKLTDEDLESTTGQLGKLVDVVQDRYGVSRRQAQRQVETFLRRYGDNIQQTANTWIENVDNFISDNPWAAVVAILLILGLVAGLIARPNMRD